MHGFRIYGYDPDQPVAVAPHCRTLSHQPDTSSPDDNMSVAGEEDPGAALDTSGLLLMPTWPPKQ